MISCSKAHTDQDEANFNKALDSGEEAPLIRHPQYGHVLYLHQDHEAMFQAPTLVFANASTGGEIMRSTTHPRNQNGAYGSYDDDMDNVELLAVPNLPGRLLRFDGRLLHAVPRPANLYLRDQRVSQEDRSRKLRSVVLFNVWPIEDPPGIEVTRPIHNAKRTDELPPPRVSCFPRAEWKELSISSAYEGSFWERFFSALLPLWTVKDFNMELMGVEVQRGMEGEVVHLKAGSSVDVALTAGARDPSPKRMYLEQRRSITWEHLSNRLKKQQDPKLPKHSSSSSAEL